MTHRKVYSPDFKREAVRLAKESGNMSRTARDLGVHASMLRKWRDQLAEAGQRAFPGNGSPRDEEVVRLKRDNARLEEELTEARGVNS